MLNLVLSFVAKLVYLLIVAGLYCSYRKKKLGKYILTIILGLVLSNLIKITLKVPRPIDKFEGYSFPSNHATISFAASYFIGYYAYIVSLVISISRVLVGAHRIIDILFGAILGIYIAYTVDKTEFNIRIIFRKLVSLAILLSYIFLLNFWYILFFILAMGIILFPYFVNNIRVLRLIKDRLAYPWENKRYPEGVLILLISLLFIMLLDSSLRIPLVMVLVLADSLSFFGNNSKLKINKKPVLGSLMGSLLTFLIVANFFGNLIGIIASIMFFVSSLMIYDNVFIGLLVPLSLYLSFTLLGINL